MVAALGTVSRNGTTGCGPLAWRKGSRTRPTEPILSDV
jgi:hypothetical protein